MNIVMMILGKMIKSLKLIILQKNKKEQLHQINIHHGHHETPKKNTALKHI